MRPSRSARERAASPRGVDHGPGEGFQFCGQFLECGRQGRAKCLRRKGLDHFRECLDRPGDAPVEPHGARGGKPAREEEQDGAHQPGRGLQPRFRGWGCDAPTSGEGVFDEPARRLGAGGVVRPPFLGGEGGPGGVTHQHPVGPC